MAEQDPLLSPLASHDPEPRLTDSGTYSHWRDNTASFLESPPLHYTVIALVLLDSACVLADLAYTVLSDTCTPIEGPGAPPWLDFLAHLSLFINTLFLVEIPVTTWACGLRFYNPLSRIPHATLHLFDAIIIVATFVLEVVLRGRERELASLLIILRLWRLVKLVGGIAVGAGEIGEETAKQLEETNESLRRVTAELDQARSENLTLRQRLSQLDSAV